MRISDWSSDVCSSDLLGDLKLYRVPIPVTVAANGQKQVALLVKDGVPFRTIYRLRLHPGDEGKAMMPETLLRLQNKKAEGLGVQLPSGKEAVLDPVGGHELPVGEGAMRDHEAGDKVDGGNGERSQVELGVEHFVRAKKGE